MNKKRAEKIDNIFVTALNNDVFSGASFSFSKWSGKDYDRSDGWYGFAERTLRKTQLSKYHVFDLASLTKPLATVPVLLNLFEKNLIAPLTRLSDVYSFCPSDKKDITIQQLMSHCAGFVPHREYFKELISVPNKDRKEHLLKRILEENLLSEPGKKHCYSDLGFMLLGLIIEKVTAKGLDELADTLIYRPLELQNDLFFPTLHKKGNKPYVSTEKCLWSEKMLFGTVHDDNCRALGGVAGHAGLFGTLKGVRCFCEQLLDQWKGRGQHPAYSNDILQRILKRVGNSTWTMGFDMVSQNGSSSGTYFSKESVGHLGFTGTSFWIDPEKECVAVLLTNRVHSGRDNWKIKKFRPVFHDLLMENC
ncbi:MAG TPA: class C beta-lactamase-related serine hydrolase [Desulfocapsa sulfexigens]|nr:class C beta-lactamase-related serine hydrolase [Desulfocapsa sulfexigens]